MYYTTVSDRIFVLQYLRENKISIDQDGKYLNALPQSAPRTPENHDAMSPTGIDCDF
jgi:hypothetical protein